ncbi:uncharacterized protein LOC119497357 [Sebastes umbrosus]|uniref:uncharacterized protein LOC119497357 n=1 Tax=Sebastes umbrosus TaxID=72105 RepID=UPI0018A1136D|nr:uncharacterized protein LOC119497357 [Sebastes umbrosus]
MSLREEQQMNLDTESATHAGMECQSKSSHKYLLLQVWCGMLTVAVVVMAALVISIKPKSTEGAVPTLKPDNVSLTSPTANVPPSKLTGSSLSFIQLTKTLEDKWEDSTLECTSCSLVLNEDSIYCKESSLYFIYAQVTFSKLQESSKKNQTKSVFLKRNPTPGRSMRVLVEGTFPNTTEGTVWVSKIVKLKFRDSVSIDIKGDHQTHSMSTFWGAYKLH